MLCISKLRHYEMITRILDLRYYIFKNKSSQSKWYYILMVMTVISTTRLSEMNYKKKYREFCRFLVWGKTNYMSAFFHEFR